MTDPAAFDDLYLDSRRRLLSQAWAVDGDLDAARGALGEAFEEAWHHHRALGCAEDPEAFVRRGAWDRLARRRRPRRWYRTPRHAPDLDDAGRHALAVLAGLGDRPRRVLVLAGLSSLPLGAVGAEVGLEEAEALETLDDALPGPTDERSARDRARALLAPLHAALAALGDEGAASWPPAASVRRGVRARRRTRRSVLALGAVAVLLAPAAAVLDLTTHGTVVDGLVDGLVDRAPGTLAGLAPGSAADQDPGEGESPSAAAGSAGDELPVSSLLGADQVAARVPGRSWSVTRTGDGAGGDGLLLPCQQQRYADPDAVGTLTRVLAAEPARRATGATVRVRPRLVQLTQASATIPAARVTYRRLVGWAGACAEPRAQLLATRRAAGVGDASLQLVLRDWDAPRRTHVLQVSRSGRLTTTTAYTAGGTAAPPAPGLARLQAAAVRGVCDLDGGGACAASVRLRPSDPPSVGAVPALLSEVDLPPVSRVRRPWVGTDPVRARRNTAATRCDRASFSGRFRGARWQRNLTRTFLVPRAPLPPEFGLTETVGSLPPRTARAFVEQVRSRTAGCEDRDLGTTLTRVVGRESGTTSLHVWRLRTEVSPRRSIRFWTALVRRGGTLAQIGFVPVPGASMSEAAFVALARRAQARLDDRAPHVTRSAARG